MTVEILQTEALYQGHSRYLVVTVRLPDGSTIRREIEDHGSAVAVLPYDAGRRTGVLVRQFRAPVFFASGQADTLEAVAGTVEAPDPEGEVRREAMEEAGLRLASLEHVVTGWAMPGISTERMDLYLAPFAAHDRIGPGGGLAEEHEGITVVELPLDDLARMADTGQITDFKALILVQTLRLRRPDLFTR